MGAGWYTFCVWGAVEVITEVERGVEKDLGGPTTTGIMGDRLERIKSKGGKQVTYYLEMLLCDRGWNLVGKRPIKKLTDRRVLEDGTSEGFNSAGPDRTVYWELLCKQK